MSVAGKGKQVALKISIALASLLSLALIAGTFIGGPALKKRGSEKQRKDSRAAGSKDDSATAESNVGEGAVDASEAQKRGAQATPDSTHQSGALIYVSSDGKPTNNGSRDRPIDLATIVSARTPVRPGDTVIFGAGIYRTSSILFAPAGTGPERRTVFKAAPGARVLFTSAEGYPPKVKLENYVRLEGLWFGGQQSEDADECFCMGGGRQSVYGIARGKQLVNCTIFGYREGVSQGGAEYTLYQGNRYVRAGRERYHHAIYISGGNRPGTMAQHSIVDSNIIIGGNAYGVHGWHNARSNIVTRNFIADDAHGLVMDGSDHLIANNFFWKMKGYPNQERSWGAWLAGDHTIFINNVMGPDAGIFDAARRRGASTGEDNVIANNAFLSVPTFGVNPLSLTPRQETVQLGLSEQEIDATIAFLEQAFSQPVEKVFANGGIEAAFAKLRLVTPPKSPLYQKGKQWFGRAINVGPDCPSPEGEEAFWSAFRALGLRDFDRFGSTAETKH
jgi:hypothetical protein